jgi:cytochrome c
MDRPDERDGEGLPDRIPEIAPAEPTGRLSVLQATPQQPDKVSALRWLFLAFLITVIVLAGGFFVRSVLDRAETPLVVARPEPQPEPAAPEGSKFPWFPYGATQPSERPSLPAPLPKAGEPWQFDATEVVSRIAKADLRNGRTIFTVCTFCHSAEPAGVHRLGPKLWNIMGREKASYPDYAYSAALRAQGGRWTYEEMARYLYDTRSAVRGGKMAFAGIRDPGKLADVIAFIRTLSDKPTSLPEAP